MNKIYIQIIDIYILSYFVVIFNILSNLFREKNISVIQMILE